MKRRDLLASALAAPAVLASAPRTLLATATAAAARGPLALVTADREAHVVALDLASGRVVKRVPTAAAPRSIESVTGGAAVVAHTTLGRLSILDAVSLEVAGEVRGFAEPRYTAVHPAGELAYVSDSKRSEVVTVHVGSRTILHRTPVPGPARHISISPDGRTIWTALGSRAQRIAVLDATDPAGPRLQRTFAPPFLAHDVVFAPDGQHVWVTSGARRAIAIYTAEREVPRRVLAADASPQHVAFSGSRALVASGDDGTVRVHGPDGRLLRSTPVPAGSYNVAFGDAAAVTPSLERGTVCALTGDGRVRWVRQVARAAHDACLVGA